MKKLALPALAALALLIALLVGGAGATAATTCPAFRVVHNDRIGPAVLPAGSYTVTIDPASGLACGAASKLFARFLEDYDGILPTPWRVTAEGSGKASFKRGTVAGFSVSRSGGSGGEESSLLGALCRGTFTVNASTRVGPLFFPRGAYLLYIPPRSGISCRRVSILFTRFLGAGGALPQPWRTIAQTASFYKPANPQRSAFRVEPLSGAGPR